MNKRTRNLLLGAVVLIAVVLALFYFFQRSNDPAPQAFIDLSIQTQTRRVDTVAAGQTLEYLVAYANNGTQAASGIVVMESVPVGTTFDPANNTAAWHCDALAAQSTCTLAVESLEAGGTGSTSFVVVVDANLPDDLSEIVNIAFIADDGSGVADANPGDNRAQAQTPIARSTPPPTPDPPTSDPPTSDPSTPGPPRQQLSGFFCDVCNDAPALPDAYAADYREQCALCPAVPGRMRGGYTLIVSSRLHRGRAEEDARRVRTRLGDTALPVSIQVATVRGVLRYRVAVGEAATVPEAVALRDRLSGVLPADTWITRLRE